MSVGPRVDVILPTHNGREWVEEAVASALSQTWRDLVLTVVDDVSTDGTPDLVEQHFGRANGRLRVVRLTRSLRAAGARNRALQQVDAPLVAFIDQDDRWLPDKLERQVRRILVEPRVQCVHTDAVHIDAQGREIPGAAAEENAYRASVRWDELAGDALLRECFRRCSVRLASVLIDRAAFDATGGFDAGLFGGEDWEFWTRFAASGFRFAHLAAPLLERRVHGGNASLMLQSARRQGHFAAIAKVVARHPELEPLAASRRAGFLRAEVVAQLQAGQGRSARLRIRELRRARPGSPEVLALWLVSHLGPLQRPLVRMPARLRRALPRRGHEPSPPPARPR